MTARHMRITPDKRLRFAPPKFDKAELRIPAKRYQTVPKKDKKDGRENLKTEKVFNMTM